MLELECWSLLWVILDAGYWMLVVPTLYERRMLY